MSDAAAAGEPLRLSAATRAGASTAPPADEPLRLSLVIRKGAFTALAPAAVLAGAAAVRVLRGLAREAPFDEALEAWRPRPGKVCLRARSAAQWAQVLELPHALAGDPEGAAVAALPPMRRSARPPLLDRLQAMSTELEPPPAEAPDADAERVTYVLNPAAVMSTGKTVAQVAHAAAGAADTGALEDWVAAGCPGRVVALPSRSAFDALARRDDLAARVIDAGLTEVPPGTVTVVALPPGAPPPA